MPANNNGNFRIALTGGPGGGKTTAADLFRREIGERVVVVPEAATMLFSGGFPRVADESAVRSTQTAIFHLQRNLEEVQARQYPERILLCDRGTIDGAAYWPDITPGFFESVGTTLADELGRYDAVIFFETAAKGGIDIEGGNPIRNENVAQAVELDWRLRRLWSEHRQMVVVPHNPSFLRKIVFGLEALERMVARLDGNSRD